MANHESRVLMWNLCEQVPSYQCGQKTIPKPHQSVATWVQDRSTNPPSPPLIPMSLPPPRPGQANAKVVHADVESM